MELLISLYIQVEILQHRYTFRVTVVIRYCLDMVGSWSNLQSVTYRITFTTSCLYSSELYTIFHYKVINNKSTLLLEQLLLQEEFGWLTAKEQLYE